MVVNLDMFNLKRIIRVCYSRLPQNNLIYNHQCKNYFTKNLIVLFCVNFVYGRYLFLRLYNNMTFSFYLEKYVFIGYNTRHKGYHCLSLSSGKFYVSPNAI